MKTISLEIDDLIFEETESILSSSRKPQNVYINEALSYYNNHIQKKILLEKILLQESKAVYASSLEVLKEFESIEDEF